MLPFMRLLCHLHHHKILYIYCTVMHLWWDEMRTPVMQQLPFISFAYYYSSLVLIWHFARVAVGGYMCGHGPKALLKIDGRKIRQTKFVGSSTHAAYDTVSGCGACVRRPRMCVLRACSCMCDQAGYLVTQGLSVGHVLFLTIHPHPSVKESEEETGPVQINYSTHLEDSEKERRGGKKAGHNNKPWALALWHSDFPIWSLPL